VVDTTDGSKKFISKTIKGHKISEHSNIYLIGGKNNKKELFDIDNIFKSTRRKNIYRLVNSNETLYIKIK
jgi:hypothetical protein